MKRFERTRSIYPTLPDILDPDALWTLTSLDDEERQWATTEGGPKQHYRRALILKAAAYLGHTSFEPHRLPLQVRRAVAAELGLPKQLADEAKVDPSDKSRIVADLRAFLGTSRYSDEARREVTAWLAAEVAVKEGDGVELANAAVQRFREKGIELPPRAVINNIAEEAGKAGEKLLLARATGLVAEDEGKALGTLLKPGDDGRTPFDRLKDPTAQGSTAGIESELERLALIDRFPRDTALLRSLTRRKIEQLANAARRYHASELGHLRTAKRWLLLSAFLAARRAEILDAVADLFVQVWHKAERDAREHADAYREGRSAVLEEKLPVFQHLLGAACESESKDMLWEGVYNFKPVEEYRVLREELEQGIQWSEFFHDQLAAHYEALRRFLPTFYEIVPLVSLTGSEELPAAVAFVREQARQGVTMLPVEGAPTSFLTAAWARRALVRHSWHGRIQAIRKEPYELGLVAAIVEGLENGTLGIRGARKHAPLVEHLIPKEEFEENFERILQELDLPAKARQYYEPTRKLLRTWLKRFEAEYDLVKDRFWIDDQGKLHFSRTPGEGMPKGLRDLRELIEGEIPTATIVEVLLDCHRWTQLLDLLKPVYGREGIQEAEKILYGLGLFYAYGVGPGPVQTARALGIDMKRLARMRRRYVDKKCLMEIGSLLREAYEATPMAKRLGDPGITMTDSMAIPVGRLNPTGRSHYRSPRSRSVLLFQHITAACIAFFVKPLLCNASESIAMLDGVDYYQKANGDDVRKKVVAIGDSAAKSDFTFGMSPFLSMILWPRVRSAILKLWKASARDKYEKIAAAIAGVIEWRLVDEGWRDVIWVLASIARGTASPSVIADHLRRRPSHPATKAFIELGKALRSIYLLEYGFDMERRRVVFRHTALREHWNTFARRSYHPLGGRLREKTQAEQEEVFWCLTCVQNAIVLWNAIAIEHVIGELRARGMEIDEELLRHILPTAVEHLNFVGRFDLDLERRPPFEFSGRRTRGGRFRPAAEEDLSEQAV